MGAGLTAAGVETTDLVGLPGTGRAESLGLTATGAGLATAAATGAGLAAAAAAATGAAGLGAAGLRATELLTPIIAVGLAAVLEIDELLRPVLAPCL